MRSKPALLVAILVGMLGTNQYTLGEQFIAKHGSKQVVVHTNPIPVLLHRAIPPNVGRHVTMREYKALQRTGGNVNKR